jgi:hypothetical protein
MQREASGKRGPGGVVSSPPATEEIGAMGREIESRQGFKQINVVSHFKQKINSRKRIKGSIPRQTEILDVGSRCGSAEERCENKLKPKDPGFVTAAQPGQPF